MSAKFYTLIILGFASLLLVSCSVTKRKYMPGYYIDRHSSNEVAAKPPSQKTITVTRAISKEGARESSIKENKRENVYNIFARKLIRNIREIHGVSKYEKAASNIFNPALPFYLINHKTIIRDTNHVTANTKYSSKKDVTLAIIYAITGILTCIFLWFIIAILALDGYSPLREWIIWLVVPLVFAIASLIHCYTGIKHGNKWGLLAVALLDILVLSIVIYVFLTSIIYFYYLL